MKYITNFNLFSINESIKSDKITNTLNFLSKDGKTKFLSELKSILNSIDYPLSEISDDFIQYLPLNKAKKLTSYSEYYSDSIYQWVKFWFNVDGNFVDRTITKKTDNDRYKNTLNYAKSYNNSIYQYFEKNPYLYLEEVPGYNVKINDLVVVKVTSTDYKFGYYKYLESEDFYYIQEYGTENEELSDEDCLVHKVKSYDDYYTIVDGGNKPLKDYRMDYGLSHSGYGNTKIDDANFALVINIDKLIGSDYKRKGEIEYNRSRSKENALALKSNRDIQFSNLKRYISKILVKYTDSDLTNLDLNDFLLRCLGYRYIGLFILTNKYRNLNELIRSLITYLEDNDDYYKRKTINNLRESIDNSYTYINNVNITFDYARINLKNKKLELFNKIEELSKVFYEYFKKIKIDDISDLELIYYKIKTIHNYYQDSTKTMEFSNYNYIMNYAFNSDQKSLYGIINEIDDTTIDKIIININHLIKLIKNGRF